MARDYSDPFDLDVRLMASDEGSGGGGVEGDMMNPTYHTTPCAGCDADAGMAMPVTGGNQGWTCMGDCEGVAGEVGGGMEGDMMRYTRNSETCGAGCDAAQGGMEGDMMRYTRNSETCGAGCS